MKYSRIFNVLVLFIFLTGAAINSTVSSSFSVTEGQQPINVSSKNFPLLVLQEFDLELLLVLP